MSLTSAQSITLFENLIIADHYDKILNEKMLKDELLGFYHSGEGGIAPGVAAGTFQRQDDFYWPHYRAHAIPGMVSKGIDIKRYIAEHRGKESGCCKGRTTFNPCFPDHKVSTYCGLIGLSFSPAVGWGWAAKRNGRNQIVMLCSGDGSYGQGRAHEAMLMAKNWHLPIIFWCENNGMAIYSEISERHPSENISSLAIGYDIPAIIIDGQDLFACGNAALAAIAHCREGHGPIFIESKTLRFKEHNVGVPDLAGFQPRSEQMLSEMRKRDPVALATQHILSEKILTQVEIDKLNQDAVNEVAAAWEWADGQANSLPTEESLLTAIYAP